MRKDQKKKWAYVSRIGLLILTLLFTLHLSAQNKRTITGTILDEKGESIIGASVAVKGTANGTITDIDGKFSLDVNENDILAITYVGFLAQEIPVTGKSNLQITLKENAEMLDEIVVVGYGVMRKRDLTGAVSSIDSKSMQDKPVANIGEALQGRASGVQIINSGAPGSNVSIRIRGISTINNSEPLLVIDGVPTDLSLNALNMDDVQTVDVLKDASATAIYGSRGANGVVIITTKKGKSGDGVVSFSANWGIQNATSMPDMLNASQFASYHNDMIANYSGTENLMQRPDFADPTTLGKGTDWMDELFRTSTIQNYSVSYSGGTDKSNYYVSAGILDQEGIVTDTSYKRYTVQFNGESKVKPWLKLGNNVTLSHDAKKQGSYSIRDAMAAQPTQPVYNEDGTYSGPGNPAYWYGDIKNPLGNAKVNSQTTKGYNLLGNIFAEINFFDKVTFKTLGGIDFKFWDKENFSPKYDWKPISQPESYRYEESNKSLTYLWDNTLTYIDTFNENHHLNVMIGSSAQNNVYNKMNASVQGFLSDKNNQLSNGLNQPTVGGTKNDWALLSFMGRVNYNYTDKYLLTLTVRRDGSSRFSKDNRWGTFPSVAAAWRLSEEAFYQKNKWVNDIKVRAGYGVTGNQWGINEYAYFTKLKTGQYVFNGTPVSTLYPLVMPNPDVKWETVKQWNAGIDLSLIDQRINLSLDGYIKNTTDMLVPMAVPITTGYSDIYVPSINAGKVRNTGWELTISSRNLTGELEWNTDLNVSYNKNKVISMNEGVPLFTGDDINMTKVLVNSEGNPINSFYGYVTNGLFQNWDQVNNASIQVPGGTAPGDIRFSDLDNNGVINDNDRTYIGNPTPEWSFSMNNSFAYKNFDLQIFLQGVAGNDIYNANRIWQEGMAVPQNQTAKVLDRWTGEGTSNSVPRAVYSDPNKNARHSSRFVEDGSYLRIKNLTLGYTLPQAISKKAYLQTVRMYMSCQNLYTMTKYSGFDPEVGANGIDLSTYPLTRTISFGVNVKF
ncbi:TonB-dependent receptor [Dysgonomonas sp. GY75]|uniref:SusC/RagA family TonB-linked outer membrane protein n=1 Tax=Dysgonomonas sp. GY75 TaxID=2780419 RepID=UPI0018837F67|nr:TonB-dependent receptor [Dysgonomonas sp. GY75]MBF0651469.1 TonB-dependent receptor [Dysgonomonas sp. GY75]